MAETVVQDIYDRTIKVLPAAQRLALATLILNDISPQSVVDYSEQWSEEDYCDFSQAGWGREDTFGGESDG
jgi:hypothetical protein